VPHHLADPHGSYRVATTDGQPWSCTGALKYNGTVVATATGSNDLWLQAASPQAGDYTLEIDASASGNGVLEAATSLPPVTIGQLFVGTIYRNDGSDDSQIDVPDGLGGLRFTVETVGNISSLDVWRGSIGSDEHWSARQSFNPQ